MDSRAFCICLAMITMPVLFGCDKGDTVSTVPVSGTVTLDGEVVADASVAFLPDTGPAASGVTDASGKFTLTTTETGDGAVVGNHAVIIVPHIPDDLTNDSSPEGMAKIAEIEAKFPAMYADASTSGFKAGVKADGPNDAFTFDMVTK